MSVNVKNLSEIKLIYEQRQVYFEISIYTGRPKIYSTLFYFDQILEFFIAYQNFD